MTIYNYKFYKVNSVSRDLTPKSEFAKEDGTSLSYM